MSKRERSILPNILPTQVGMLPSPLLGAIQNSRMINTIICIGKVTQILKIKKKIIKQP